MLVEKAPQTPQGTRGFMTVPESSRVLDRFFGCRPNWSYIGLKVLPAKRILRYCSPTIRLTPRAVATTHVLTREGLSNTWFKLFRMLGMIPRPNKRPPRLRAKITIVMVKNILLIPPRLTRDPIS